MHVMSRNIHWEILLISRRHRARDTNSESLQYIYGRNRTISTAQTRSVRRRHSAPTRSKKKNKNAGESLNIRSLKILRHFVGAESR